MSKRLLANVDRPTIHFKDFRRFEQKLKLIPTYSTVESSQKDIFTLYQVCKEGSTCEVSVSQFYQHTAASHQLTHTDYKCQLHSIKNGT